MKLSLHKPLYLQEWQKLFPFFFFANCYIRSKVGFALKLLIEIVKKKILSKVLKVFYSVLRFSFFSSFFSKCFQQGNLDSQILPWIFKYVSICIIVGIEKEGKKEVLKSKIHCTLLFSLDTRSSIPICLQRSWNVPF